MTAKKTFFLTPKLAMTAIVATGMAASPIVLQASFAPGMNTAAAQEATDFVEGHPGPTTNIYDSPYEILGTTVEEMRQDVGEVTAGTAGGPTQEYEEAMRDGNLSVAAKILAQASNRPVTEALVLALNNSMGIETSLVAKQVADAAAEQQDPMSITKPRLEEDTLASETARMALGVHTRQFRDYEDALRRNNLTDAAEALAAATDRPITENLVQQVNTRLGVETNLTITQIAEAASVEQKRY